MLSVDFEPPRCAECGHRAEDHTGVTRRGYSAARISCRVEVDRGEICRCDGYDMGGVPFPSLNDPAVLRGVRS